MTIFGIAGSMALMLVGFGLQDSISDIAGNNTKNSSIMTERSLPMKTPLRRKEKN